jgi:hypothetical protein
MISWGYLSASVQLRAHTGAPPNDSIGEYAGAKIRELLAYLGVATDGRTGDPAALDDYLAAVDAVLSPQDGRVG